MMMSKGSKLVLLCSSARRLSCRQKTLIRRTSSTSQLPDLSLSSVFSRRRCDKLSSLHSEYHIISIIDSFVSLGMVDDAETIFNHFRRIGHQFDVEVYNKMIFGWAQKGSTFRAGVLFKSMIGDGVQYNLRSYAALLAAYAEHDEWANAMDLLDQMEAQGYQLKHILHQSNLDSIQTGELMKVLRYVGVKSEPPPKKSNRYPKVVDSFYKSWLSENRKDLKQPPLLSKLFKDFPTEAALERQFALELRGYAEIPSIAEIPGEVHKKRNKELLSELQRQWKADLTAAIQKDIDDFFEIMELLPSIGKVFRGPKQFPFLALLPAHEWTDILMDEIVDFHSVRPAPRTFPPGKASTIMLMVLVTVMEQPDGLPLHHICRLVGQAAWVRYVTLKKKERECIEKVSVMYKKYMETLKSPHYSTLPAQEIWKEIDRETVTFGCLRTDIPKWPRTVNSYVVSALVDRLLEIATIPENFNKPDGERVPAFERVLEVSAADADKMSSMMKYYKKIGYIRAHRRLYNLVKKYYHKDKEECFRVNCALLPMFVPPRPWTSPESGGYLLTPTSLIRCDEDTHQHHLLLEQSNSLHAVFDSLNTLGTFPWTINKRMLKLATDIFNSGGDDKLAMPGLYPDLPREEVKELTYRERVKRKKLQNESYSLWMDMLYRLSLAHHYRNDVFWLPQNMDFRGRVYPMPPHLTHITMDVGRALLKFAVGYPLGEKGLDWLKIHLVNLQGEKKKESLQGRLDHANSLIDDIMDSADRPLEGRQWWQTGDSPWQVLACCMEITDAIRSGDPTKFVTHIPVQQDGSCNGLQHYAALGRDYLGGKKVNLMPSDQPEDTYAGVAAMVEEKRKEDAAAGNEIAILLEGKINRKVVKQTVMTVVYGVTWVGGRLQIEKQLHGNIPEDRLWDSSNYLVGCVFDSLRKMFSNAREIQDWLASSARKVGLAGRPMEWLTPLGLPVVQPYHKVSAKSVKVELQALHEVHTTDFTRPPDIRRQKNGMPPNYVHSLDSTHMMLTSLCCHRGGIPFVAVHDSYWTHACFVDEMNKHCREQFVVLHKQPILQDLANFWEEKFGGLKYKDYKLKGKQKCQFTDPFPSIGDLDLEQVLKSTYFFN